MSSADWTVYGTQTKTPPTGPPDASRDQTLRKSILSLPAKSARCTRCFIAERYNLIADGSPLGEELKEKPMPADEKKKTLGSANHPVKLLEEQHCRVARHRR